TTYMMPSRLWSTVTTHSCRMPRTPDEPAVVAPPSVAGTLVGTDATLIASPQRHEIRDELVELSLVELHGRHEGARLERGGVFHPGAKILRRVAHGAGP